MIAGVFVKYLEYGINDYSASRVSPVSTLAVLIHTFVIVLGLIGSVQPIAFFVTNQLRYLQYTCFFHLVISILIFVNILFSFSNLGKFSWVRHCSWIAVFAYIVSHAIAILELSTAGQSFVH